MKITKETFIDSYKKLTLKECAKLFKVSEGTIKNYAKKLNLSKGKGNKVNHNRLFDF